jgi:hypothetical protein
VKVVLPDENVPELPVRDRRPFVRVPLKTTGPPMVEVNVMVPEKLSNVVPVPAAVLVKVKVSKLRTAPPGGVSPPRLVTETGIAVAVAPGPLDNVVVPPELLSVTTSVVLTCPKIRIVAALAELASASDARPAIANRISEERMGLFLPVRWKTSWIVVMEP